MPKNVIHEFENLAKALFKTVAEDNEDISSTVVRLNKDEPALLYRIYQTLSKTGEIDDLRKQCLNVIRKIYPNKFYVELGAGLLMGIPGDERIAYDWHQEIHYHSEFNDVIHFWLPVINSTSVANGTMSVLTSSHKRGKLPFIIKPKSRPDSVTNLVIQNISRLKVEHPEVFFVSEPGDMVGLDSYLVHRSNSNSSDQVRFVVSCRLAAISEVPEGYDFKVKT